VFAVAAHLEPEILVVDEVLAVGDAEFQKKAIGKMQDISKGDGRTVLFVSHNMASVNQLCSRAMVLDQGSIAYQGDVEACVEYYLRKEDTFAESNTEISWKETEAPGSDDFKLLSVSTTNSEGKLAGSFIDNQEIQVHIEAKVMEALYNMRLNFKLYNSNEVIVFSSSSHLTETTEKKPGVYRYKVIIPPNLLNQDSYKILLQAGMPGVKQVLHKTKVLSFRIEKINNSGTTYATILPGVVAPKINWEITSI